ncbi:hypothetical protein [Sandarakinorhabdus sp. DWP1-3-1]|uniref:hypothetical protein n=1 Tax=Sandarakinorhabdus sp. DWP1-3-1 TaxID=2804627 RepID=UPI003CEEE715
MIRSIFILAATLVAAPALAQDAAPALAQDAAPAAPAAPTLPTCSAKVTDGCVQSAAAEKRAMTGEQADMRDAAHGGAWTPDGAAKPAKKAAAPM